MSDTEGASNSKWSFSQEYVSVTTRKNDVKKNPQNLLFLADNVTHKTHR